MCLEVGFKRVQWLRQSHALWQRVPQHGPSAGEGSSAIAFQVMAMVYVMSILVGLLESKSVC